MSKNAPLFAFARNLKTKDGGANLKTEQDIKNAQRHAERRDRTSAKRRRSGADPTQNLCWSKVGTGFRDGGTNYQTAFQMHKDENVASDTNGAKALHLIVGVSPDWLAEVGSIHDPDNPRIRQLIDAAVAWAEDWGGAGCVWGWRYDLDEKGGGIVDVLSSPIRVDGRTKGKSVKISVAKALRELQDKHRRRLSYEAMQDDWAVFAQQHLDIRLQRGEPGSDHIDASVFAQYAEEAQEKGQKVGLIEATKILSSAKSDASKIIRKTRVRSEKELKAIARKQAKAERNYQSVSEINDRTHVELQEARLELTALKMERVISIDATKDAETTFRKKRAEAEVEVRRAAVISAKADEAHKELSELRKKHILAVSDLEPILKNIADLRKRENEVNQTKSYLAQVFIALRRIANLMISKLGVSLDDDLLQGLSELERDMNAHIASDDSTKDARPAPR